MIGGVGRARSSNRLTSDAATVRGTARTKAAELTVDSVALRALALNAVMTSRPHRRGRLLKGEVDEATPSTSTSKRSCHLRSALNSTCPDA
jgi:hypothetical protein